MSSLNSKPYYNTDAIATNAISPDDICNCYMEPAGDGVLSIRRRPGLKAAFCNLGTGLPGDGLFYWDAKQKVIAVSGGQIFDVAQDGTVTNLTGATLASGAPVSFADGSKLDGTPWLYMANGKFVYSEDGAATVAPTDPLTPSTATHAVYLNRRFLANTPGTNQFLFTDTNPGSGVIENDYWSSSDNPLVCEARGDNLTAMNEFLQEIYNWGTQSVEVWHDDGITPFSPIPGATIKFGLEAPYSIAQLDNTICAMGVIDNKRCIIKLQGRSPVVISEPIASILAGYSTISDAIGQMIGVGGMAIYLLQFPTEGKTWAYDIKNDTWIPWGTWDLVNAEMGQFIGQHTCYAKAWNKHLIMSRIDGKIYELDRATFMDASAPMKTWRRTAWIDHGTMKRKRSDSLYFKIKQGFADDDTCYLRWADDGRDEWSKHYALPLSPIGDKNFVSHITRMGIYRSRRYEFSMSDNADMVLVGGTEDVIALGS